MIPAYQYKATILDVHDGDTVHLDVDLGFQVHFSLHCRLYGINAPELATDAGKAAHSYLLWLLGAGDATPTSTIYVQTIKDQTEKYGRYLGVLFRSDQPGRPSVNQLMVSDGFAVSYYPNTHPRAVLGTL